VVDTFNMITEEAPKWRNAYDQKRLRSHSGELHTSMGTEARPISRSFFKQLAVLSRRYLHIMLNDRVRTLLILLQALLLGLSLSVVADGTQYENYNMTRSLLFALTCSAFWVGILNAIQEVCKERNILKRECMTGLRIDAYITSKMLILALVCLVQTLGLVSVFAWLIGLPAEGIFGPGTAGYELFVATFLAALAASAMGIFVSSLFKNADRAMTLAPLLLMPQLLFSGIIFELGGITNILSFITVSRWTMQSYGTTANLNALDMVTREGLSIPREFESMFEFTRANALFAWGALAAVILVCVIGAMLVLRRINQDRR